MIRTSVPLVKSSAGMRWSLGEPAIARTSSLGAGTSLAWDFVSVGTLPTEIALFCDGLISAVQEYSVQQLKREQSVNLCGVIAITLEMAADNSLHSLPLQIWPR